VCASTALTVRPAATFSILRVMFSIFRIEDPGGAAACTTDVDELGLMVVLLKLFWLLNNALLTAACLFCTAELFCCCSLFCACCCRNSSAEGFGICLTAWFGPGLVWLFIPLRFCSPEMKLLPLPMALCVEGYNSCSRGTLLVRGLAPIGLFTLLSAVGGIGIRSGGIELFGSDWYCP